MDIWSIEAPDHEDLSTLALSPACVVRYAVYLLAPDKQLKGPNRCPTCLSWSWLTSYFLVWSQALGSTLYVHDTEGSITSGLGISVYCHHLKRFSCLPQDTSLSFGLQAVQGLLLGIKEGLKDQLLPLLLVPIDYVFTGRHTLT